MEAVGEDEEGEPKSGALHEEPGQRWVNCGAPSRTEVLAVGCLEEQAGDEGWGSYEKQGQQAVVEEALI